MSIFLKTVMENIDNKRIQIINDVIKKFNSNWKDDMMCSECIGNFNGIIIKKFKKNGTVYNGTDYIIVYYEYNQYGQEDQRTQIQSVNEQTYYYECYIIKYDKDTYTNLKELISDKLLFTSYITKIKPNNILETYGQITYEMSYTELRF